MLVHGDLTRQVFKSEFGGFESFHGPLTALISQMQATTPFLKMRYIVLPLIKEEKYKE